MLNSKIEQWMSTWNEVCTESGLYFVQITEGDYLTPLWVHCGSLLLQYQSANTEKRDEIIDRLLAILEHGDWLSKSKALIGLTAYASTHARFLMWIDDTKRNGLKDNPRFPNCASFNDAPHQKQKLFVFSAIDNTIYYLEHGRYRSEENTSAINEQRLLMEQLRDFGKDREPTELDKWFKLDNRTSAGVETNVGIRTPQKTPFPKSVDIPPAQAKVPTPDLKKNFGKH